MSGKGSKRRNENTAAVEANWPTNWNARDGMSPLHGDASQDGAADGAGHLQPDHGQGVSTGPRG